MQRSEIYHCSLKKVTNSQLLLKNSISVISIKILFILKNLNINKNRVLIDTDLALDINAFQNLVNVINIDAI